VTLLDLMIRFGEYQRSGNLPDIRRLLTEYPDLLNDPECRADTMIGAARHCESPDIVALLHEFGVPFDIASVRDPMDRPLYATASPGRWRTMRWLVEHGAGVNWEVPPREPYCVPLPTVIRAGRLDMVKLLVEAGALLDVCDRRNKTPLAWAIDYKQTEIADYLRSKGAVLPQQARNYQPPPPKTPVMQYMESHFGSIKPLGWQPIIPAGAPVVVHSVWHQDFAGAVTDGMSTRPMAVPPGKERYRFAELALPLGDYWTDDPKTWGEDRYVWAIQWLLRIADYPFEAGTWLGDPHCVIANGDPPEPLSAYTPMTCWLLLVDKAPLTGFSRADGTEVVFYTLVPIHTAERDFERQHGLRALLEKFAERDVSPYIDPQRESVV
jgi:hypothetical protein